VLLALVAAACADDGTDQTPGLVDIDPGDPQVALDALIADVNARGGIHGRTLEAHLEVIVLVDATAADEACVRMTEDIQGNCSRNGSSSFSRPRVWTAS
jgi:hypothetical protein